MSEAATQAGAEARLDAAEVREELDRIGEAAVAQVGHWLRRTEDSGVTPHASAQRLAAVLSHPRGLEFTVGFVDRVIRTEDNKAAAEALAELGQIAPDGLGFADRAQIKAGAMA
ncbi:MAG TPA: hypothetical protein H9871_10470, partial [Candidatus Nesterenkonia stercoripullorum]|nr:hypothetical protein [Candidatus Nesterenkonia stercoripullorum]